MLQHTSRLESARSAASEIIQRQYAHTTIPCATRSIDTVIAICSLFKKHIWCSHGADEADHGREEYSEMHLVLFRPGYSW